MKTRAVYEEVSSLMDFGLCCWCKFGECVGDSCCDSYIKCQHPLETVRMLSDVEGDYIESCWAFRPGVKLDVVADIAGIVLNHPHPNSWSGFNGKYKVFYDRPLKLKEVEK